MITLHFGVTDIPYSETSNRGKSKTGKSRVSMTGEIAQILEDKYHIMETFWQLHQEEIVALMGDALTGGFESLLMGAPASPSLFESSNTQVQALFARFLSEREMDSLGIPGVPTKASLEGVNHRFKTKKGAPRPSFIDTGQYESSMRTWVTE